MTSFTDLVGCSKPIQLAGMGGGISDVALATAVCEAGGLGMVAGAGLSVSMLGRFLDELPKDSPFGINFLMPFLDQQTVAVAAERARVVEFFYADPDEALVEAAHEHGALVSWQVGSKAEADAAARCGCDLIVAQGMEAGGHVRGTQPLLELLSEVVDTVPVVAAGGLGTPAAVKKAFESGASAVRVGTRFLAATEASTHPEYVAALIEASSDDTTLTEAFSVGWPDAPHRVLSTSIDAAQTADEIVGHADFGEFSFEVPRWSTLPPTTRVTGNVRAMALYAGTSVGAVRRRQTAAEIIDELLSDL